MLHPKLKAKLVLPIALIVLSIPTLFAISGIPALDLSKKEYKSLVRSKSVSNSKRGRRVAQSRTPRVTEKSKTPTQNQPVTIPESSAIAISFPAALTLDIGHKKSQPSGAILAHPILDSHGNVIAAANSPVILHIQPVNKGAQIIAESIVIGGRVIPIHASSLWIPGKKVTNTSGTAQAQEKTTLYKDVGGSVVGLFNSGKNSNNNDNIGHVIGAGIGFVSGLTSAKSTRQVEIAQGSVFVMTLQTPINVPESLAKASQRSLASAPSVPTATPTTSATTNK